MSSHSYNQDTRADRWFWSGLAFAVVCIIAACLLTGCSSSAERKLARIAVTDRPALAKRCAADFPPRILVDSTRTVYVPGKDVPVPGPTTYVTADCPPAKDGKVVQVRVPCPPNTVRVDTVYKDHYRQQESTDALEAMQADLGGVTKERDEARGDLARLKKGRSTWRWIGLGGLVLLAAGFVLKLKKIV